MKFLILTFTFFVGFSAQAHNSSEPLEFAQTIYGNLDFREVELIARNHNIGLYRGGAISLAPWIQVSEAVYLGIDSEGRLLQILNLPAVDGKPARTVGYILSGNIKIKDFFLSLPGTLMAIDAFGQFYRFEWQQWHVSKLPKILKRAGLITAGSMCIAAAATVASSCYLNISPWDTIMLAQFFGLSTMAATIQGFFVAVHYESDSQTTDGLIPIGEQIVGYRLADQTRGPDGRIVDYQLRIKAGTLSLRAILQSHGQAPSVQSFALRCEHDLLARGINPVEYEP